MEENGKSVQRRDAGPSSSSAASEPAEAQEHIARMESALAFLQEQLSEADDRTHRLQNDFAAFRARRSVRAAATVADAAYAARRFWSKSRRPGSAGVSSVSPTSAVNGLAIVEPTQPAQPLPTDEPPREPGATLRISAVVPCFNGAAYLEEALSSIKTQTRLPDEIIVVDDGSTDGSAELAERCGATVIRHGSNRGEAAARNTGWRAATGDAIAWLDSDDSWRPFHLEVVGALLERYPEVAAAFGSTQRFGLDDQVIPGLVPAGEPCELLREAFQSWLHAHNSCIIRRAALEGIGGYDEQGSNSIDFDMWLRLAQHNRFVATHEVTANWRWHVAQQSAAPVNQIVAVQGYRRRFLTALRAEGEYALAQELEPLVRPSWTAHLEGVRSMVEQRKQRTLESLGQPYRGPTLVDRVRWAVLFRLHPSVIVFIWPVAGRALEPSH
jgi:hypothetical protein